MHRQRRDTMEQEQTERIHQGTNGLSVAALVLGIVCLVSPIFGFIMGILALIFGAVALNQVGKTGQSGRGMAITGLVCGIFSTVIMFFSLAS